MNNKQAILIMAHNNINILKLLIKKLDSLCFDIFLHLDQKSYISKEELNGLTTKSKLYIYKEISVKWADYSQVECEFYLIDKALNTGNYEYFHLISGADFPLKKPEYIYDFFHNNYGKEFVHYQSLELPENKVSWIVNKTNMKLYTGANWFSITDSLARYVLSLRDISREIFIGSKSSDEFFLQTFVYDSPFKDKLYNKDFNDNYDSIKRKIDWKRGHPYVWTINDYDELINSPFFFARKFAEDVDFDIVERLFLDV